MTQIIHWYYICNDTEDIKFENVAILMICVTKDDHKFYSKLFLEEHCFLSKHNSFKISFKFLGLLGWGVLKWFDNIIIFGTVWYFYVGSYWNSFGAVTVCSYHVTYAFQSESTVYSCLNVKELLSQNRREIWSLLDCDWLSVCLRTKRLWVRVQLQFWNSLPFFVEGIETA